MLLTERRRAAGVSHLRESQGVEADTQNGGPRSILDFSEDPSPFLLCLIIPKRAKINKGTE